MVWARSDGKRSSAAQPSLGDANRVTPRVGVVVVPGAPAVRRGEHRRSRRRRRRSRTPSRDLDRQTQGLGRSSRTGARETPTSRRRRPPSETWITCRPSASADAVSIHASPPGAAAQTGSCERGGLGSWLGTWTFFHVAPAVGRVLHRRAPSTASLRWVRRTPTGSARDRCRPSAASSDAVARRSAEAWSAPTSTRGAPSSVARYRTRRDHDRCKERDDADERDASLPGSTSTALDERASRRRAARPRRTRARRVRRARRQGASSSTSGISSSSSSSTCRRVCAACSVDFTVPTAQPIASAISSSGRSA